MSLMCQPPYHLSTVVLIFSHLQIYYHRQYHFLDLRKLILVNSFVGWLWWYYQGKPIGSGGFLCYLVWALQNDCSSPRGNDPISPSMSANILWWEGTYTNKFFFNQHLCLNIKSELFNAVMNCIQFTINL